jgi:hypothetical protein
VQYSSEKRESWLFEFHFKPFAEDMLQHGSTWEQKQMWRVGDHVLSNRETFNKVALHENILQGHDASEHFPVLGMIKLISEQKVLDPEERQQVVRPPLFRGYVKEQYIKDGFLRKTRQLRLQNNMLDPVSNKDTDGISHMGVLLPEGSSVFILGKGTGELVEVLVCVCGF